MGSYQPPLEWCYTAEILESDTLVQAGFAKAAYEPDELLPAAYSIAEKIVKHSQVAVALTRQMMYRNSAQEHPRDLPIMLVRCQYFTRV